MKSILFREEQQFSQAWIWVLLIGVLGLLLWGIFQQEVMDKPFGDNPAPTFVLVLLTAIPLGLLWFFAQLKLTTTITSESIELHFKPLTKRVIPIAEIRKGYIRKYRPISEFGGWGLRYGSKGMAYNVAGDIGLQLELKNGKHILIGTQKENELEKVIKKLLPFG